MSVECENFSFINHQSRCQNCLFYITFNKHSPEILLPSLWPYNLLWHHSSSFIFQRNKTSSISLTLQRLAVYKAFNIILESVSSTIQQYEFEVCEVKIFIIIML